MVQSKVLKGFRSPGIKGEDSRTPGLIFRALGPLLCPRYEGLKRVSGVIKFTTFKYVSMGAWELGEQGWRSGESTRLPPMWPGFDSRTRRHMWIGVIVKKLSPAVDKSHV